MRFIWDILIVAILVFCIWRGYRKGLIKTLFGLLGVVLAFVGALALKEPLGGYIDKSFVHAPVERFVLSTISGSAVGEYEKAIAEIDIAAKLKEMPPAVSELLDLAGVDANELAKNISSTGNDAKKELVNSIASPISETISKAIAFVILFIVLCILCIVAAKFLSAVCNLLPLGKQVNHIGGLLAGLIKGGVIVLVLCTLVGVLSLTAQPDSDGPFSKTTIEQTVLMKKVIGWTPAADLIK